MLPKNNRNIFPDQTINCQTSSSTSSSSSSSSNQTGNQQPFRPPVSVSGNRFLYNPNLVVTQQQQPSRINHSFPLNSSNSNNNNNSNNGSNISSNNSNSQLNQIEVVKRIAAAMQQPPNHPMHLINRQPQNQPSIPIIPTPLQVNQNSQLDRPQMIRIPTNPQESSAASNLCQALYLIQQNLIFQNDKSKQQQQQQQQSNNHLSDICKPTISSNPSLVLNNSTNSLSAITINSSSSSAGSQNPNATVLAMSNVDVQILEAFNRLNSQQNSKSVNSTPVNSNLSLIQSDSNVAQQLINALQKQSPRTSSIGNSQGFMLIGQTSKPTQINLNNNNIINNVNANNNNNNNINNNNAIKSTVSFSPAPSTNLNVNTNNEMANPLLVKTSINSKGTEIPLLTKLLDKLSHNPNLAEIDRQFKLREIEESQSQRNINSKLLSSESRQVSEAPKYSHESVQRSIELLIATNSSKLNSQNMKSHNNTDTHQILRDSKEISYLMPNSASNTGINNDDMINQHFNKSLRNKLDVKKNLTTDIDNSFNFKPFSSHQNSDESMTKTINNIISNKKINKNKICSSFIDLERPESLGEISICENSNSNLHAPAQVAKPTISNFNSQNNKLSIKETADKMVENLIKRSLNNCSTTKQHHKQTHPTNSSQPKEITGNSMVSMNNKISVSSSSGETGKFVSSSCNDGAANNSMQPAVMQVELNCFQDKIMIKNRINPSKHDLPLKKRIMLDFNENCNDNTSINTEINNSNKIDTKFEIKQENIKTEATEQQLNEKQNKIRRKRIHNDSLTDSGSMIDPNVPVVKKRRGRIPGTGKKQKMKEECRLREMEKINSAGTEESWHELTLAVNKPPDIDKISAKTLCVLDLEPLKISKVPFFQIGPCNEIAPRMVKCRSCRQNNCSANNNDQSINTADDGSSVKSGSKDSSTTTIVSSFCRFHGFRKLQFSSKGTLTQAGFCRSYEADSQDLSLWRMYYPLNSDLSISTASYIIECLSEIFCQIIETENQFVKDCYETLDDIEMKIINKKKQFVLNGSKYSNKPEFNGLVWKRPVQGVREMCDVCDTSIFNTHWACRKCGYSVCVDCFIERQDKAISQEVKEKAAEPTQKSNNQTIPAVKNKNNAVHQNTRGASRNRLYSNDHVWAVCTANRQPHIPDQLLKVELIPIKVISELRNRMHTVAKMFNLKLRCHCLSKPKTEQSPKLSKQVSSDSLPIIESSSMSCENDLHLLADLALKEVVNGENKHSINSETSDKVKSNCSSLRPPPVLSPPHHPENVQYANSQNSDIVLGKQSEPDSNTLFSWIYVASNFKIVRLHNAQHPDNLKVFQQELLLSHPVIVSGCHKSMDLTLWTPEKFLEEFELEPATLVDCETGFPVPKGTMKSFWEGFECVGKRITCSDNGSKPACLKLKDWPPSDDFNDVLPQRCKDILNNLPIKEYTGRQGELNLAGHLPEFFVRPDLGPKLYNAYGMPRESKLGTTSLHLDIADAVNVMLYVGVPKDSMDIEKANVFSSMKEAMIDENVIKRAELELPGALWHIFLPKDVPKLRQFLYDILVEQGEEIDSNQDPIHDQQFYLDQNMLKRLKQEYNVEGCAIVQFRGDAIFIPAGSPHQVRNLHSCMKVANDFVSPENILQCLQVTKEFRKLSPTHANHEDKLQAKNMIFHAMKDAVATLIMKSSQYSSEHFTKTSNSYNRKRKNSQIEEERETLYSSVTVKQEPHKGQSNRASPNNNNSNNDSINNSNNHNNSNFNNTNTQSNDTKESASD